jgi:hypothetical protein
MGARRVDEELSWKVGHEPGQEPREKARPKAYFYWKKKNGQLVRSAEFTQPELEAEIERLSGAGEDTTEFVLALKMLALSRGAG